MAFLPCAETLTAKNSESGVEQLISNSWLKYLEPDPAMEEHRPNKEAREVDSGHYVLVAPTRLPNPGSHCCYRQL
jgi:hypothetical protein